MFTPHSCFSFTRSPLSCSSSISMLIKSRIGCPRRTAMPYPFSKIELCTVVRLQSGSLRIWLLGWANSRSWMAVVGGGGLSANKRSVIQRWPIRNIEPGPLFFLFPTFCPPRVGNPQKTHKITMIFYGLCHIFSGSENGVPNFFFRNGS